MKKENQTPDDPLGLENVDQQIRLEKLRAEVERLGGKHGIGNAPIPPEIEEMFLENVLMIESQGAQRPIDALLAAGMDLPPADELTDEALTEKLWEVIHALAERRFFLESTNHLSDRELYEQLRETALHEEAFGFGLPFGNCHYDFLGSGSDEHITMRLRYYADEMERQDWLEEFPDFPMPPAERPPFDRDRKLPRPLPPR